MVRRFPYCRAATLVLAILAALASRAAGDEPDDFDAHIAPLLVRHCLDCHQGPAAESGLDLTSRKTALAGGESGQVLVPGKPEESRLWHYVRDGEMPPEKPLGENERQRVHDWIAGGARWGTDPIDPFQATTDKRAGYGWWSLQPIARPVPPALDEGWPEWTTNPIDAFIAARLRQAGLAPSPEADRRTLIRRLSFDLIGLPPSPEAVEAFIADDAPDAYERLVDRLLASPRHGERWARHWLDVARYGESQGFERDRLRPNSWPYRDWVIAAFNRDLPYDHFARLQLAGDVLAPDSAEAIVATGFLVAGPYDEVGQKQQSQAMKAVVREDELEDILGTVGQTFLGLTIHCARCHDHKFDPIRQREYYQMAATLAGVRHGERSLAEWRDATVYAVVPSPPPATHVLLRGNPGSKGELVVPAGIAALGVASSEFGLAADASDADRRIRLADWIASPDNPLFARVIANRLWHYHFGVGIVDSPNDFGFSGGRPSHPELLDYLAACLIDNGWRLKSLHRLIVTSAAYRQASISRAECVAVDADNRLLWRKNPLRLEAETIRDAVLFVSGQLNKQMGGPPYHDFKTFTFNSQFYEMSDPVGHEFNRRTIYRAWLRSGRNGLLDVFDCPDPSTTAPRRAVTVTPGQSLALMNNSFLLRMADHFAERADHDAAGEVAEPIQRIYQLALARLPSDDEIALTRPFVASHGLAALCRVIFNSNEFLHVD